MCFFLLCCLAPGLLRAGIRMPAIFGDNMVLQQRTQAALWGWARPGSTVRVTTSWNRQKYTVSTGAQGQWKLGITTPAAGGPFEIEISDGEPLIIRNILIGEVWFCSGQSNMEMPMKGFRDQPVSGSNDALFAAANPQLRLYTVPRAVERLVKDTSKASPWKEATPANAGNFSATAYFFGKLLQEHLHVPVALINDSYGGSPAEAFMSAESLQAFPEISLPAATGTEKLSNKSATTLYNGMIHPLAGYTIKGCIWYQGESNQDRPDQYEKLFPAMVALWRREWGQGDFPFYFAQIAPFNYGSYPGNKTEKMNSAYLRDAQRKALHRIPASGMVVLMDKGEENSIHPADKSVVGKRFAYLALADTYRFSGYAFQSPDMDSLAVSGNIATVRFRYAPNGLTAFGQTLQQFEIAGADKHFYPAQAVIRNGTVQVSSSLVPNPVAVRYAFKDFIKGELFSTEGYPVSSFRTDDW
ncbi:sialate O-acetylesterase [Sediminibacterium soli]|uniref:sialate O-acetylesterase n=1 Tax=Sediminibacterium soli TaxID=2698829 RepID=UPI00137A8422|nr:sialate O-acetylesterase [Sediminibacterium soli]NCI48196.1 sialate O-acetylesterase [Sediminibacterium soli]